MSGNFAPGRLVPMERVVDFGHYLNWRFNDVAPPDGSPI